MSTANLFFVGSQGDDVVILRPSSRMTRAEALNLAAWLVAIAELPYDEKPGASFAEILEQVRGT